MALICGQGHRYLQLVLVPDRRERCKWIQSDFLEEWGDSVCRSRRHDDRERREKSELAELIREKAKEIKHVNRREKNFVLEVNGSLCDAFPPPLLLFLWIQLCFCLLCFSPTRRTEGTVL